MTKDSFIKMLESHYVAIKNEYFSSVTEEHLTKWPQQDIYNDGWNVFGLRFQGYDIKPAHDQCPVISKIIKDHSNLIDTLGFSILNPGTIITPHKGITDTVLRCHMGIQVPEGDCAIKVDGVDHKWQNGIAFIFDDTLEHSAWNKTNEKRIVMLMDLKKTELEDA